LSIKIANPTKEATEGNLTQSLLPRAQALLFKPEDLLKALSKVVNVAFQGLGQ
jgi:hypothetical protein